MSDVERELGRLAGEAEEINKRVERIDTKLDKHIEDEDKKLTNIEHQLSLGRFMLLAAKALILTVVAVLAFKFGDIGNLWKTLK